MTPMMITNTGDPWAMPWLMRRRGGRLPECRRRNLERLRLVYGPATWSVYERLDSSLDPTGPDTLFDLAAGT